MSSSRIAGFAVVAAAGIAVCGGLGVAAWAQQSTTGATPKRHLKIERPAHLSKADAVAIYDNIADQLARGYAASDNPAARNYRKWRVYNSAPYRSATHGNRYVNNFGNPKAAQYAKMDKTVRMPEGAILAKNSFTVTADGDVFGAPLFLMEKLHAGASQKTNDWRYVMLLPDGSLFGDSAGEGADKVAFCHGCHRSVADRDNLFFVPKKYRKRFLKVQ